MTQTIEERRVGWLDTAKINEDRNLRELEFKCRAAARWLERPEQDWKKLKGLVYAIDAGRLEALATYVMTPEEVESWRNYMMSR